MNTCWVIFLHFVFALKQHTCITWALSWNLRAFWADFMTPLTVFLLQWKDHINVMLFSVGISQLFNLHQCFFFLFFLMNLFSSHFSIKTICSSCEWIFIECVSLNRKGVRITVLVLIISGWAVDLIKPGNTKTKTYV